jgi:hypothetical protein
MSQCNKPRLLKLSKIDAARRQLESAIWLWFVDADIVSVHTLAAAAHRLLLDLAERRGIAPLLLTTEYFAKHHEKEPKRRLQEAEAFFTDAKSAETYAFDEVLVELRLFDAVMAYASLFDRDSRSALMSTFVVRFGVQRPDLFAPNIFPLLEKNVDDSFNIERLQKLSKLEFLQEFFGFLGQPAASRPIPAVS